jgi:hypothetical protein
MLDKKITGILSRSRELVVGQVVHLVEYWADNRLTDGPDDNWELWDLLGYLLENSISTLNSRKISKIWDEMRIKFECSKDKIGMKWEWDLQMMRRKFESQVLFQRVGLNELTCNNLNSQINRVCYGNTVKKKKKEKNFISFSYEVLISKLEMQSTQYYNALVICAILTCKISRISKEKWQIALLHDMNVWKHKPCSIFIEYSKNCWWVKRNDYLLFL